MMLIGKKYKLGDRLGEGGTAITYKATDTKISQEVAIKVLSLDNVDWKQADVFERREVKTLRQLTHPRIPRYIDYFVSDNEANFYFPIADQKSLQDFVEEGILIKKFYLVQELVKGKNLVEWRQNINKVNEKEVKNIAIQVLKILIYLQSLTFIHRDIKPQNLIYTDKKEIFLVDFGAVPDQIAKTSYGTTFIGTKGYMAPEQGSGGKVSLATDLYGLGATLIYLLSGKNPSDLPIKKLKINFRKDIKLSSHFAQWLDVLLEFEPENRFQNAQIALDVLEGKGNIKDYIKKNIGKPKYSSISLTKTKEELTFKIPCALNRKRWNYTLGILAISVYIIAFLILLIITMSTYNIFLRIPSFIYAFLLIIQTFKQFKKIKVVKFVILGITILPFILNLNYSMISAFFLLGLEVCFSEFFSRIIRDLLFDNQLKINKNKEIFIQEKFSFISKQNRKLVFQYKPPSKVLKLLTRREKQWLTDEIQRFFKD
ncbi:MAG: serine/threonine protein kinase [Crocosphaera sp.]